MSCLVFCLCLISLRVDGTFKAGPPLHCCYYVLLCESAVHTDKSFCPIFHQVLNVIRWDSGAMIMYASFASGTCYSKVVPIINTFRL